MEKDEETRYKQSVSWNNETSLWLKSEYIHEYIHDKAADAFPFMIHISDVMSYCSSLHFMCEHNFGVIIDDVLVLL